MLMSVFTYAYHAYIIYIIAWAFVLLVRIRGQYQSLVERNSSIAVPLFCCTLCN